MQTNNGSIANDKLNALLKRQSALRAALRAEREKRRANAEKEHQRLIEIVGRAVLANAEQSPEFKQFILGVLRTSTLPENEQRFLKTKGWL